ncbi:MAG: T9SS type A sorting domain-containing protein [Candidatus Kapaibacterium sp.]
MKSTCLLIAFALFAITGSTLFAQDTCKVYSLKNPHGAEMDITKIWVVDSVNFRVRTIKALPFHIGATESFDIEVCILARDGKPHTSQVRYQNTHGTSSYNVTMTGPAVASVSDGMMGEGASQGVSAIAPNPATDYAHIQILRPAGQKLSVRLYNILGDDITATTSIEAGESDVKIDVKSLANGRYFVAVVTGNSPVTTQSLMVSH